jgi:hypothetical protein
MDNFSAVDPSTSVNRKVTVPVGSPISPGYGLANAGTSAKWLSAREGSDSQAADVLRRHMTDDRPCRTNTRRERMDTLSLEMSNEDVVDAV